MSIVIHLFILGVLFVPTVSACSYLYRQRGAKKKDKWTFNTKDLPIIALGSISFLFTLISLRASNIELESWILQLIGTIEICSWYLLCKPSWGEIFPWDFDTHNEKFPPFIRPVTNWIVGYKYDAQTAHDTARESLWKIAAWIPRMGIYGIPLASIKCYAAQSLAPVAIWIMAAAYVGIIYRRNYFDYPSDWIDSSEKQVGGFLGFVLILMALP